MKSEHGRELTSCLPAPTYRLALALRADLPTCSLILARLTVMLPAYRYEREPYPYRDAYRDSYARAGECACLAPLLAGARGSGGVAGLTAGSVDRLSWRFWLPVWVRDLKFGQASFAL
jgi:hypothetical protein